MPLQDEVIKTYEMLKSAGFTVQDVVFEGAMRVKGKTVLEQLDELSSTKKAVGTVKIVYSTADEQVRTIEIPVGEPMPELKGAEG